MKSVKKAAILGTLCSILAATPLLRGEIDSQNPPNPVNLTRVSLDDELSPYRLDINHNLLARELTQEPLPEYELQFDPLELARSISEEGKKTRAYKLKETKRMKLTAYDPICERCCPGFVDGKTASGRDATKYDGVAVSSFDQYPKGSIVIINHSTLGEIVRIVDDIGGGVEDNQLDVRVHSHDYARELGVSEGMVSILVPVYEPAPSVYVIQKGDSPSKIADKYGLSVPKILSLNGLDGESARLLRPGYELKLK